MSRIDPTLRTAAILLAVTVAVGAAAKLGAREAEPAPGHPGKLAREFRAPIGGPVRFSGALEGTAVLASADPHVRMELVIGADGARAGAAPRVPTDLVVVLDHSGSMAGEKLERARVAVRRLIEALGEGDRFALVTYSDGAAAPIPLGVVADRRPWLAIADSIQPAGGTNMSSGLDMALGMVDGARGAGRAPRVVLISDGLANQGDASREGLVRRAARAARGEYALSTVGVGADFDEGLMAALADAGTGNFHFLADAAGLDRILTAEFATARETVAASSRVVIEPAPGVEVVDAAGYPLAREANAVVFQPGSLFAGQERRIWVTLRVPAGAKGEIPLGRFALEYGGDGKRQRLAFDDEPRVAAVADEADYFAGLDAKSWERGVVVDQYNALRRKVAEAAKDGRERDAVTEIKHYRAALSAKNAKVGSEEVSRQLADVEQLEKRLEAAASGIAPMAPLETKELRARGYESGRPGAARQR